MINLPQPDGSLSAWDVKGVAADVIGELPLPGIEDSPLDPGDIWPVVTLASVNQTSVREVCAENSEAPCDDTVFDWLHTLDRGSRFTERTVWIAKKVADDGDEPAAQKVAAGSLTTQ